MAGENETLGGFGFEEDPIETSDAQDPPAINDREEVGGFTFQQDEIERET
jgi:hypothetical protein